MNAFDIFFARNVASGTSIDLHGPSGGWVTFPVAGAGQGGGVELTFVTDIEPTVRQLMLSSKLAS
ncbi:MAG: hypothetical protein IAE78_18725 [Myxococcus sp.]|nr:hypothetical protein [Myxococcus sp.]